MDIHEPTTDRRGFLALGGIAGAALLAACGSDSDGETAAATTTTTISSARDVALLRTASSLEALEVEIYKRALAGGVVKTPAAVDMMKVLQAQHGEHAALFQGHTSRLGGEPFADPHPPLLQQFQGRLGDEASVLRAAFDLAQIAAATYQAAVGGVDDKRLDLILMSIAGVEARHAALIGTMVNQPVPVGSFAATDRAIR